VQAKAEYFKAIEQVGIPPQFRGFGNDLVERILKMMN
jgi:hypothetical protein